MGIRLLFTAAALTFGLSPLVAQPSPHKYSGAVLSASDSQLVLKVGTESLTFRISKETALTLNGKTVAAKELKMDDSAEVSAVKTDGVDMTATAIAATRKTLHPSPGIVLSRSP